MNGSMQIVARNENQTSKNIVRVVEIVLTMRFTYKKKKQKIFKANAVTSDCV